jgi:uncharacterized membrane-anchored protein
MQSMHVPFLGLRYWFALCLASIFGANMGDFFAHILGLGHVRGLPILAAIFAAVYFLEKRDKVSHEAYYWLAIIVVRTAATNLADLAASDLKQPRLLVMAVLVVALAVSMAAYRFKSRVEPRPMASGLPDTCSIYWTCMLIAGTLGTVLGDYSAVDAGLGLAKASIALSFVLALMFYLGRPLLGSFVFYWPVVVMVRAAGTAVGDFLASHRGLGLGLPVSTAITGLAFVTVLIVWKKASTPRIPS